MAPFSKIALVATLTVSAYAAAVPYQPVADSSTSAAPGDGSLSQGPPSGDNQPQGPPSGAPWEAGPPQGGAPQGGAQHGGAQHGGAQHGGAQHGGAQHGGAQHGGRKGHGHHHHHKTSDSGEMSVSTPVATVGPMASVTAVEPVPQGPTQTLSDSDPSSTADPDSDPSDTSDPSEGSTSDNEKREESVERTSTTSDGETSTVNHHPHRTTETLTEHIKHKTTETVTKHHTTETTTITLSEPLQTHSHEHKPKKSCRRKHTSVEHKHTHTVDGEHTSSHKGHHTRSHETSTTSTDDGRQTTLPARDVVEPHITHTASTTKKHHHESDSTTSAKHPHHTKPTSKKHHHHTTSTTDDDCEPETTTHKHHHHPTSVEKHGPHHTSVHHEHHTSDDGLEQTSSTTLKKHHHTTSEDGSEPTSSTTLKKHHHTTSDDGREPTSSTSRKHHPTTTLEARGEPTVSHSSDYGVEGPVISNSFSHPSLLKVDGSWYSFASSSHMHVQMASSSDFKKWTYSTKDAMPDISSAKWIVDQDKNGISQPSGPDVIRTPDNKYVMQFSAPATSNKGTSCLGSATSDSVEGPYVPSSSSFLCGANSSVSLMDPSFFTEDDGSLWLLYTSMLQTKKEMYSSIMLQELSSSGSQYGLALKKSQKPVTLLSGKAGQNVTSPYMSNRDGSYFLTYTSSESTKAPTSVEYAVSSKLSGSYKTASKPLLAAGDFHGLDSPCSLSVERGDDRVVLNDCGSSSSSGKGSSGMPSLWTGVANFNKGSMSFGK